MLTALFKKKLIIMHNLIMLHDHRYYLMKRGITFLEYWSQNTWISITFAALILLTKIGCNPVPFLVSWHMHVWPKPSDIHDNNSPLVLYGLPPTVPQKSKTVVKATVIIKNDHLWLLRWFEKNTLSKWAVYHQSASLLPLPNYLLLAVWSYVKSQIHSCSTLSSGVAQQ